MRLDFTVWEQKVKRHYRPRWNELPRMKRAIKMIIIATYSWRKAAKPQIQGKYHLLKDVKITQALAAVYHTRRSGSRGQRCISNYDRSLRYLPNLNTASAKQRSHFRPTSSSVQTAPAIFPAPAQNVCRSMQRGAELQRAAWTSYVIGTGGTSSHYRSFSTTSTDLRSGSTFWNRRYWTVFRAKLVVEKFDNFYEFLRVCIWIHSSRDSMACQWVFFGK